MQQFESVNLHIIYPFYVFLGYVGNMSFCTLFVLFCFVLFVKPFTVLNDVSTVFVPLATHAHITAHQSPAGGTQL